MQSCDTLEIARVEPDTNDFFTRAMQYLRERGRTRVGFINPIGLEINVEKLQKHPQYADFDLRPQWCHLVHQTAPHAGRNVVHLMMQDGQRERPNALIIGDDNLVENATMDLIAAGVRVPEDVEVIAHCNFPHPTPSVVPVNRLGFDSRQILQACINSINGQRRGATVPKVTKIPALFENEISAPEEKF